jgi:pimeloyl-ACP methyl ester carboxylesterase
MDMFYLDTRTDGPTILCLHGRWGRAETWSDFIQRYGHHYRVIAPDQRGHGLSSKPASDYTAEEMAEDVNEFLAYLALDSVVLVGHSMGGRVAGYVTAMYPKLVKAVAILDRSASVARIGTPTDQSPREDPLTSTWPMPFATLSEAKHFIQQATDSDFSYQYFMNSLYETVEGYQMLFSGQAMATGIANDLDWFHLLPKIECPALLIRSKSHEAISDADFARMQALLPNCTAREMSHPDHNVQLANKEEFYDFFDAFMASVYA